MTERVGQQLGHYQLQRLLGQGGFAEVYLGEHIHLKNVAAIKVLHTRLTEDMQKDFLKEAQMLARLLHPHIIRVLDFGTEDGVPYLVMDYAPGGTLRQCHGYNTKLPLTTVVDYAQQIGEGLQYAHDQKLIHRDLKPENVLIGPRGELLLSDFGVALIAQSTRSQEARVNLAGTASYIAPEQLSGKPGFASDQYALGIMVYEWLCGTRPFKGSLLELYSQHYLASPPPLREYVPELHEAVEWVVLKAVSKSPDQRYGSVKDFVDVLRETSEPTQIAEVFQDETLQMQEPVAAPLWDNPRVSQPGISQVPISALQTTQSQQIATPSGEQSPFVKGGVDDRRKGPSKIKIFLLIMLALLVILSSGAVALYAFSKPDSEQAGKGKVVVPATSMCPPLIKSGSTGTWVRTLQTDLNTDYSNHSFSNVPFNFSPPLMTDGIFGPMTMAAVQDYQSAKGLRVDGIVGPKTWHALGYCQA